jgi:hypothetical protein
MGSSESHQVTIDPNFKMQRYLNQGLNQKQVLMVREIFESYEPVNGCISAERYKENLMRAETNAEVVDKLAGKETLSFD